MLQYLFKFYASGINSVKLFWFMISRFIITVRYLKLKQLYYQIYYRLTWINKLPKNSYTSCNNFEKWDSPQFESAATSDGLNFNFLNEKHSLTEIYTNNQINKLWLYNFHYQNDLVLLGDKDPKLGLVLINSWIKNNNDLKSVGWEPYCISLRGVNWIKFLCTVSNSEYTENIKKNLFYQFSFLEKRLEKNILANHLFSNSKALIFAGSYYNGQQAQRWLKKGLKIIDKEIKEQFLPDGGHYERSPMYHCLLLWDLADLINLSKISGIEPLKQRQKEWAVVFKKGIEWLNIMTHPDKGISFFNDSTFDVAPTVQDLEKYERYLKIDQQIKLGSDELSINYLRDSGYASVEWGKSNKLICDIGNIGPSYQPGHSHASTLSCELSVKNQRILVNSGISTYERNNLRHSQRSTQSHNTATLDRQNSSDVWASFRVGKRAFIKGVVVEKSPDKIHISAAHNGFRKIISKKLHRRTWDISDKIITVTDEVTGNFKNFQIFWHFHPTMKVTKINGKTFCICWNGQKMHFKTSESEAELIESSWFPGFNLAKTNIKMVINAKNNKVKSTLFWK